LKRSQISLVVALLAVIAAIVYFDLTRFLNLSSIKTSQSMLMNYFTTDPIKMILGYFVIYVLVTALSLPGATVMTLAGGMIFGFWLGALIVSFASSIGASLAFLVSRFLFRDFIQSKYGERLSVINQGMAREGRFYLFSLRLIPAFPFFLINLLMGLTPIKLREFFLVSQVGMLPGTLAYVNAGTQLGQIESAVGILSPTILISFALLGIFPLLAKKLVDRLRPHR
jgi:uncharacterized membrane protein YdjX (TVP38/TMEM64 family)